jgi:hypothetical protein
VREIDSGMSLSFRFDKVSNEQVNHAVHMSLLTKYKHSNMQIENGNREDLSRS